MRIMQEQSEVHKMLHIKLLLLHVTLSVPCFKYGDDQKKVDQYVLLSKWHYAFNLEMKHLSFKTLADIIMSLKKQNLKNDQIKNFSSPLHPSSSL